MTNQEFLREGGGGAVAPSCWNHWHCRVSGSLFSLPFKFHQHRLIVLVVDGLGVTAAIYEGVGSVTPLLHVTPNCDFGLVEQYLCYQVWLSI